MKKTLILLLVFAVLFSALSCGGETEETESLISETLCEETQDTDTETEAVTETATEPAPVIKTKNYRYESIAYRKANAAAGITLHKDPTYGITVKYSSQDGYGGIYNFEVTETGGYEYVEDTVKCFPAEMFLHITFDKESSKKLFLNTIENYVKSGILSKEALNILTEACGDEGATIKADRVSGELDKIILTEAGKERTLLVIDEQMTAYDISEGVGFEDGRYFMPENNCLAVFNGDGTFYLQFETEAGRYTATTKYEGSYTEKYNYSCSITAERFFIRFNSETEKADYEAQLDKQYEDGYISRVNYEYYKDALTEEGAASDIDPAVECTITRFGPAPSHVAFFAKAPVFGS